MDVKNSSLAPSDIQMISNDLQDGSSQVRSSSRSTGKR